MWLAVLELNPEPRAAVPAVQAASAMTDAMPGIASALIPAWTIDCRRCANEGAAWNDDRLSSAQELAASGWTFDYADNSVYCPRCSA